jgi:hypothetical protein
LSKPEPVLKETIDVGGMTCAALPRVLLNSLRLRRLKPAGHMQ